MYFWWLLVTGEERIIEENKHQVWNQAKFCDETTKSVHCSTSIMSYMTTLTKMRLIQDYIPVKWQVRGKILPEGPKEEKN
jgi:hypothetical protein